MNGYFDRLAANAGVAPASVAAGITVSDSGSDLAEQTTELVAQSPADGLPANQDKSPAVPEIWSVNSSARQAASGNNAVSESRELISASRVAEALPDLQSPLQYQPGHELPVVAQERIIPDESVVSGTGTGQVSVEQRDVHRMPQTGVRVQGETSSLRASNSTHRYVQAISLRQEPAVQFHDDTGHVPVSDGAGARVMTVHNETVWGREVIHRHSELRTNAVSTAAKPVIDVRIGRIDVEIQTPAQKIVIQKDRQPPVVQAASQASGRQLSFNPYRYYLRG